MPLARRPLLPNEPDYERWLAWLFPLAWFAAWLILFVLPIKTPPCPMYYVTGIPCPGCGSTRSTLALAHGNLLDAIYFNPLWVLICLTGAVVWMHCLRVVLLKKARPRFDTLTLREERIFRYGAAGILLSNWLWVILRETAFTHP